MNACMRGMLCLLLLLPLTGLAANSKKAPSVEFYAIAWADVDALGTAHVDQVDEVTKLEDVPGLAPAVVRIKELLKQRLETWQFVPATREGVAVASRTCVYVRLEGTDDGKGGLGMRILSASTGPGAGDRQTPHYPPAAMREGIEGLVVLVVEYDKAGRVTSVKAEQSNTIRKGKLQKQGATEFKGAAIGAAWLWTFQNEIVAGEPKSGSIRIPVQFCMSSDCENVRLKLPEMPDPGQFAAIDPAVKLRSAVAGTAL
jgi:TonB family protein